MTRKRFIKLCMSFGYGRNQANEMADDVVKQWVVTTLASKSTLRTAYWKCPMVYPSYQKEYDSIVNWNENEYWN